MTEKEFMGAAMMGEKRKVLQGIKEGVNVNEMMPVLKTYLGHSSTEDTFYYYHLLDPQSEASRRCIASSGDIGKEVLDAELI